MSTFVEIIPTVSTDNTKTTAVRLDLGDLKVTVREEKGATISQPQFNYTGLDEGDYLTGAQAGGDPIEYVNLTKLGSDARAVIGVKVYHAEGEEDTVPGAGIYWYRTSSVPLVVGVQTQYDPNEVLRIAKGEVKTAPSSPLGLLTPTVAKDSDFAGQDPPESQTLPSTIFNISTTTGTTALPTGNSVVPSFTAQRLYDQLGSLNARRQYLKEKIRNDLDNPLLIQAISGIYTPNSQLNQNYNVASGLYIRYQVWAEVLSIDANLDSEYKFNLINGELSLDFADICKYWQWSASLQARITNEGRPENQWRIMRFGTISNTSPWTYTPPAPRTESWINQTFTTPVITRTGINFGEYDNWLDWIRS